jgi:hypothetical protein
MGAVDELKGIIVGLVLLIFLGFALIYMVLREMLKALPTPLHSSVSIGNFDALFMVYFVGTLFVLLLWLGIGSNSSGGKNENG